jgi:predicted lipoprotein with Yx(FWY)xxD motif
MAALAGLAVMATGCGAGPRSGDQPYYGAGDSRQPFAAGPPSTVASTTTALGTILVDGSGRTLYLFSGDHGGRSACVGACATVWPPFVPATSPVGGAGVAAAELGTTTRAEGAKQLTYNGHPLYRYAGDRTSGDTRGQGLRQFGETWYVVAPCGRANVTSSM